MTTEQTVETARKLAVELKKLGHGIRWAQVVEALRPLDPEWADAVAANLHRGAWRKTAPDHRRSLHGYLLRRKLDWHRGKSGGSLWGPMMDGSRWPAEADLADTRALCLLALMGRESDALTRWRKAIYG